MAEPSNTEKPLVFAEQRQKWEKWLIERKEAETLQEPLLIFVDDEEDQRAQRYYEMRQRKHPGRNILLFEKADEAIEFLKFSAEKKLNIASVITDFDNGTASDADGNQVLEQAIEYEKAMGDERPPVVKLLISSITRYLSKTITEFNSHLPPEDKKRFAFISKDSPYHIAAAPPPAEQIEAEKDTKLIPDLIYSMRVIDIVLDKFRKAATPYQGRTYSPNSNREKSNLIWEIFREGLLGEVVNQAKTFASNVWQAGIDILAGNFTSVAKLFQDPFYNKNKKTIGEVYEPVISAMERTQSRIQDMLKIWALIKYFDNTLDQGKSKSSNPHADEPEEAITIRILGAFFLDEFKRIQWELKECSGLIDTFGFSEVADVIRKTYLFPQSTQCIQEVSKVTHNLKNPFSSVGKRVGEMVTTVENFLCSEHPNMLSSTPGEGEHRLTHQMLRDMIAKYLEPEGGSNQSPHFYYYPATKTSDTDVTRDRTSNTPGAKAPVRETIIIPFTDEEIAQAPNKMPVAGIASKILGRFKTCVDIDQFNYNRLDPQETDPSQNMAKLAGLLVVNLKMLREEANKRDLPTSGANKAH